MGRIINNNLRDFQASMFNGVTTNNYQAYANDILQKKINNVWEFANDVFVIQEETIFGSKIFTDVNVRINHVVTSKISDTKLSDDYRGIIFKEVQHSYGLGYVYQFDNNYWLTINSDIYRYPTANATVRRCNNVLSKYIYDSNGAKKLIQEPCAVDAEISKSRDLFKYSQAIILPQADIYIFAQNNSNTKNIDVNDRFLLDGVPFKIQMKNAWQRSQTMVKDSAPLIYLCCNRDQISPLDDLENNIADGLPAKNITNTSIIIALTTVDANNPNKIKVNHTQSYSVYKYDDQNNKLTDTFTITASGCDFSYYTLNIIDGNNFSITNLKGNGTQYLTIHCVDNSDTSKSEDIKIRLAGRW